LPDGEQLIVADIPLTDKIEILPAQGWPTFPATGAALFAVFGIYHVSGVKGHGVFWAQYDRRRIEFGRIVSLFAAD
jgi:hypothetical protein